MEISNAGKFSNIFFWTYLLRPTDSSWGYIHIYCPLGFQVPWEDLRYLFGEIMYGGHITDDWDRRLCRTYLEEYMQPHQVWERHQIHNVFPELELPLLEDAVLFLIL